MMDTAPLDRIVQAHQTAYRRSPTHIVRAPGRVNLIGDHTDYNDGFVLPMAIDRWVWIALSPRDDRQVHLHSLDIGAMTAFDLDRLARPRKGWSAYAEGVGWALLRSGLMLTGWQGVLCSDVPMGAGLSSSAALEMAVARAFCAAGELPWDAKAMALAGQRAENAWVGMNCGIMDQLISAAGEAGHALCIDCRALSWEAVPLPPDTAVMVLDTTTKRGLVGSAYNQRREQCDAASAHFKVEKLRDVTLDMLSADAGRLPKAIGRRVWHVVTENLRTREAVSAMRTGDARRLGELMIASHGSLRDDFEVSSPALDQMVASALEIDGCLGARMTGAGFGGCAVALVRADAAERFTTEVASRFHGRSGMTPRIYVCRASDGAELISGH